METMRWRLEGTTVTISCASFCFTSRHRMPPLSLLGLLLFFSLASRMGQSCEIPDGERQFILDRVKAKIVEQLGPPPATTSTEGPTQRPEIPTVVEKKILSKRHSQKHLPGVEDTSQVILFPSSDILCEANLEAQQTDRGNNYSYVFRPSSHVLSRRVSSLQFWFFTGKSMMDNSTTMNNNELNTTCPSPTSCHDQSPPLNETSGSDESMASDKEESLQGLVDIQVLSEVEPVTVATTKVQKMDDWTVFDLAPAFFRYFTRSIFVLLVHCPDCVCSDVPENTPFLMFHTLPIQRGRRSGVPWSPSVLELLQRPPVLGEDSAQCHRGSINISFEELGWNQWIVHPGSFQFHYCHGTCSPSHGLTPALHWGHCCAALPSTMKPLRVTTTTDGGFSFRYETVPNLLTQDCACS